MKTLRALGLSLLLATTALAVTAHEVDPKIAEAAFAASDRPAAQVERDAVRKAEVAFILHHVKSGDRVLDMGAGQGYMSYLLSSAVGPTGTVYVQNPQGWVDYYKMAGALDEMKAKRPNVQVVVAPFTAIPAPLKSYDVIVSSMIYHDTYNEKGQDALAMNKALFGQLKSGGLYIIVDHHAPAGSGTTATNTTHRIDKKIVIDDLNKAGFLLVDDEDILSHPEDKRDLNVFDPAVRGKTDRFVLVFKKP
ncbi:methyltransferase domain-containing protein [Asticcacaulis sp. BYS171W]|uniref:Methyltransferase domain-containing protein n=1 Tax=Asticcacaulis aquaticus TaxID=2984212 RepID=A0ABT5HV13_9CAUL|nr:methyltransferase domain-containing protein [Asticcacaulis aquaticus]MDC7683908.1 methyltransferase domain-containing protein [Asticcacaulis aquaticus]